MATETKIILIICFFWTVFNTLSIINIFGILKDQKKINKILAECAEKLQEQINKINKRS